MKPKKKKLNEGFLKDFWFNTFKEKLLQNLVHNQSWIIFRIKKNVEFH